jgi:hypothetical protein
LRNIPSGIANSAGSPELLNYIRDLVAQNTNAIDRPKIENHQHLSFPNPSTGLIYFQGLNSGSVSSLSIFNSSGQKVRETSVYPNIPVNLNGLENGIYYYRLQDGQIYTGKIVLLKQEN